MTIDLLIVISLLIGVLALIAKFITNRLTIKQKNWWIVAHLMFVIVYFSGLLGTLLLTNMTITAVTDLKQIHAAHIFSKYCDWF